MTVEVLYASEIVPGDTIQWSGRNVSVGQVENGNTHRRGDVWLTIGHPDLPEPRRCHYWANERIRRVV